MEKEALLKIILQDIKELETLVNTFSGKEEVPAVFTHLAKSKTQGILDEISLFEGINKPQKNNFVQPAENTVPYQDNIPTNTLPEEEKSVLEIIKESIPDLKNDKLTESKKDSSEQEPIPDNKPEEKKETKVEFNAIEDKVPEPKPKSTASKPFQNGDSAAQPAVLGDVLGKNKQSFNEKLAGHTNNPGSTPKFQQPINDLRKAFGINDRFFFQRELFGSNAEIFNQTIDQINEMNSYESAISFISGNFNWDQNNEAVVSFKELIKRRFLK